MLELSVFGKSHLEVFLQWKNEYWSNQNSILNNMIVLAFLLEFSKGLSGYPL